MSYVSLGDDSVAVQNLATPGCPTGTWLDPTSGACVSGERAAPPSVAPPPAPATVASASSSSGVFLAVGLLIAATLGGLALGAKR